MTILLLRLLLSFCFHWKDTSNTRDSVSSAIQSPRIRSKILRCASYFQLSSRCLDIPMKHCLSCLIYYVTYIWDSVATGEFEVNSVNKDIVNKCGRIIVNSSRLVNYWRKGVTLYGQPKKFFFNLAIFFISLFIFSILQQKIMRKITGFWFEDINVEIAHNIYRFISRA